MGRSAPIPSGREATAAVRAQAPGFLFLAEVYWDLEWTLQQQGFDYTYDKRLYDRLVHGEARPVREHLFAGLDYQDRLARFLENHDEPRAAATFPPDVHRAAAVVTFLTPGLRFFHQGQREGKRVRIPMHLGRGPVGAASTRRSAPSTTPARVPARTRRSATGAGSSSTCRRPGRATRPRDDFIAFAWSGPGDAAASSP